MNRSALILHLLLKDFRHQRGWLALLWLLALLLPISAGYINPGPIDTNAFMIGSTYGFKYACIAILLRIIQLDPPGRGIRFLSARPVDWFSLLASKVLFVGAFLLVPIWIESLGTMYALGIQFNLLDQVLFLVEVTISTAALLTIVALPAFFLRKLSSVMMTLVGMAALIFIGSLVIAD